ncbi:svop-1, partial [Symbiodinium microadriaticum]
MSGGLVITMAGFLSGFSPNYLSLLLLRGAVGFGLGSSSVPFDLLAEFLPASRRGSFLIYIEYFWTVGSVMVAGSAWLLLSRFSWRVLTYITAIPVSLACLGSIPLLPESPRWLLTQGRAEEAERIILSAVKMNGAKISAGIGLSKPIVDDMESRGSIMDLCSVKTLRVSIPLCILWCSFGMAYYATILFNGDVSQHDDDVNDDNDGHDSACSFDYASTFYSALSEVIGCSIVAVIIERWGRVRSQTVLYTAAAMGAIGMGLSVSWPGKAVFTGMSVLARLGVFSASAATWVHTPELFRTEVRATGHACANAMSQLGSSAGPFIVYRLGNVQIGLLIAALNITCVICALCLPETV